MKRLAITIAAVASAAGVAMSAAAAMDRGGSIVDRALMCVVSGVIVICAHLLPAITKNAGARLVWVCCLLATAWGHAAFFTAAQQRAGAVRAEAVTVSGRAQALQAELDAIQSRPVSAAATEVAAATARAATAEASRVRCERTTPGQCGQATASARASAARASAAAEDLTQAHRGAALRSALADEAGRRDIARAGAGADPVAAAIGALTGTSAAAWSTGVSVFCAALIEIIAAFLWAAGLARPEPGPTARRRRPTVAATKDQPSAGGVMPPARLAAVIDFVKRGPGQYRQRDSPAAKTIRKSK